ncbi:MAG: hypothetical protein QOD72_2824, partial [Acidimicrobiaceae bacterium]|nr:hypothetical protein [Acidimicrobiaceae bacterium]
MIDNAVMLAERFKTAVETGRVDDLVGLYAPDAHLDARLAGREVTADGPDAIVAVLAAWWPVLGRLDQWDCAVSDGGVRVMLERAWDADGSTERIAQFHNVHVEQGRISRHDVFSSHARFGLPPTIRDPVPSFLRDARSREPLPHAGDSGSYLERVVLADGNGSIVKHISPSFDWIMRATHDTGREAELWLGGYLRDLPSVEVPMMAVERECDGWAIAQRDVSDALIADRAPLSREETRRLLEAADVLHR